MAREGGEGFQRTEAAGATRWVAGERKPANRAISLAVIGLDLGAANPVPIPKPVKEDRVA